MPEIAQAASVLTASIRGSMLKFWNDSAMSIVQEQQVIYHLRLRLVVHAHRVSLV
jgi:hypothetical protein